MKYYCFLLILFISCKTKSTSMGVQESELVKDSVSLMTDHIISDLTLKGPIAWLDYFEDSPGFFMAVQGTLAFGDFQSANAYIRDTLVKTFRQISLKWDHLRIDPLTSTMAFIGTGFHEDIIDSSGRKLSQGGYFSALAVKTFRGWQLRNVHWSMLKP
jgi:hypothetical protein